MTHIDEHTLELFVLGAKEVQRRRKAIGAHLKKCEGCRTLVRTMTEFYANADAHLKSQPQSKPLSDSRALIRSRTEIEPTYDPYYSTFKTLVPARVPRTFLQHISSYAKQNPIKSVVGSFTLYVGLALILNFTLKTAFKDTNPAYTLMNVPHTALEVYNKEDEMLWQLPQPDIKDLIKRERESRIRLTRVADINGDGRNEIITTLPISSELNGGTKTLRVYGLNKKILFQKQFINTKVHFMSNHYESDYFFEGVLVDNFSVDDKKEFFSGLDNGRSPWFLARFDATGNTIGRYWHFGQMVSQYEIELDSTKNKQILLCGVNQVREVEKDQFAVVEIVDPEKIVGDAEATATRGFGFNASDAEVFYVRFPESDMETALGLNPIAPVLVSSESESQIRIVVSRTSGDESMPGFEYIFSKDMNVQDVKYESQDVEIHSTLKKEEKISSTFDQKYLNNLKNAVRYWNGREWKKELTKVEHGIVNSP